MSQSLEGRCGTCSFFHRWDTDAQGRSRGECRLGCWPSPLQDTATCAHYKAFGSAWTQPKGSQKRSRRPGRSLGTYKQQPALPPTIGVDMDTEEFREVLRQVLLEELGLGEVSMGERWEEGELVLLPGKQETQEKRVPLRQFFHKLVMVRDKLRLLEQKINAHKGLSAEEKVHMQQYITGCYGSLTTFNLLFQDRDDAFQGQKNTAATD